MANSRRIYTILIGLILLTVPCYCGGIFLYQAAPSLNARARGSSTPNGDEIIEDNNDLDDDDLSGGSPTPSTPEVATATLLPILTRAASGPTPTLRATPNQFLPPIVPTAIPTETKAPTPTAVPTVTPTGTLLPTATPSPTAIVTPTLAPSTTITATPTRQATTAATPTLAPTSPTATPTTAAAPTATPTATPMAVPTATATPQQPPTATFTPTPSITPEEDDG